MNLPLINVFTTDSVARQNAAKHVAKLTFENEGKINQAMCQEIFETIFSVPSIRQDIRSFFTKRDDKLDHVFTQWIEQDGFTDVIDSIVDKVNWAVVVSCCKVPKKIYNKQTPETNLKLAGEATGKFITKDKTQSEIAFVYGDSRVYSGNSSSEKNTINICYIFIYKEKVSRYS
jgi:hypothetical protein